MKIFRPWGPLDWLMGRVPEVTWSLFGCLGTEERSLAAWRALSEARRVNIVRLLRVHDGPSRYTKEARYEKETKDRLGKRQAEFLASGGKEDMVADHDLLEAHSQIVSSIDSFIRDAGPHVILDVTSLPKRFFFPILKRLLVARPDVSNLIVTYSFPASHTPEPLAMNPSDWAHLPLFGGDYPKDPAKHLIVGIGFEALGLQEQVEHGSGLPVKLLLPFPARPSSFQRSWDLIRKLQRYRELGTMDIYRTDAKSVSDTFDRLLSLTRDGRQGVELAPFGPKPMSVAMCIFATLTGSPVFYTQPTAYHPDYSLGVSTIDGQPEIYGYCLRLAGNDFYSLPSTK